MSFTISGIIWKEQVSDYKQRGSNNQNGLDQRNARPIEFGCMSQRLEVLASSLPFRWRFSGKSFWTLPTFSWDRGCF